jgi:hypothetical protein
VSAYDEHRWALVHYRTTATTAIEVVGPFGIRERAEDFQREHGPRLAMLLRWDDRPAGGNVYHITPTKYRSRYQSRM